MNNEIFTWDEKTFNGERVHIIGSNKFKAKPTLFLTLNIEESFSLDIKKGNSEINILKDWFTIKTKRSSQSRYTIEKSNIESVNIVSAKIEKKNTRVGYITICLKNPLPPESEYSEGTKEITVKFSQTPNNINSLYEILDKNDIVVSII